MRKIRGAGSSAVVLRASLALLLILGGSLAASLGNEAALESALNSITHKQLKRHVEVLADDMFEGREAGQRGGRAAGKYLVTHLAKMGIRGAGEDAGYFQPFGQGYRNVLGIIPGRDPVLRNEVILLGAHYDHVGYGRGGSRALMGYVHNGADDNASGTAAVLEVAEALQQLGGLDRTVLIVFWDAEEKGLLGSKHWAANPTVPLEKIKTVINVDMIGKLRDERLIVYGTRSAAGFRQMLTGANQSSDLTLDMPWSVNPRSDHYTFFQRKIPVLMLHTDLHKDYHRPTDDVEGVSVPGMQRISRFLLETMIELGSRQRAPAFREQSFREGPLGQRSYEARSAAPRSRLGISWVPEQEAESGDLGLKLNRVLPGGAAQAAGIQPGDHLITFSGVRVESGSHLRRLVHAARSPVVVETRRDGKKRPFTVELQGKPIRVGIAWRQTDAEPGVITLVRVEPESPADVAGLKLLDRVIAINGKKFADSDEFDHHMKTGNGPLEFTVERRGRYRTLTIQPNDVAGR